MIQGRLLLVLGLVVYLMSHFAFELGLSLTRPTIYEVDDQYHFLVKAESMKECRAQNCPGLNDIYTQTGLTPIDAVHDFSRTQVRHRALIGYHPLHSLVVLGLHESGLSYERSLMVTNLLLHTMAALAIAGLLAVLFGAAASGLALLVFSAFWFNPGTWVMTPFLASTFLILGTWAILVREPLKPWALALAWLGVTLAGAMHTVGVIGAGVTLLWYGLAHARRDAAFGLFALGVLASAGFFFVWQLQVVPGYIDYKSIYAESSLLKIIKENIWFLRDLLEPLAAQFGLGLLLATVWGSLMLLPGQQRRQLAAILLAVSLLTVASLLYPSPYVSLMQRLWPLVVVPLIGAFCYVLCWAAQESKWPALKQVGTALYSWWHAPKGWNAPTCGQVALANVALVVLGLSLFYALLYGAVQVPYAFQNMHKNKDVVFDRNLPGLILEQTNPNARVIYNFVNSNLSPHADELQEAVIYFATTNGLVHRGAALAPYLRPHPEVLQTIAPSIQAVLTVNPLVAMRGADWILGPQPLQLSWQQPTQVLKIYADYNGQGTLVINAGGVVQQLQAPASEGWVKIVLPVPVTEAQIELTGGHARLRGIGLTDELPSSFWPWDAGLTLAWREGMLPPHRVVFARNDLAGLPGCLATEIVQDKNSLVYARVACNLDAAKLDAYNPTAQR